MVGAASAAETALQAVDAGLDERYEKVVLWSLGSLFVFLLALVLERHKAPGREWDDDDANAP